jgi:hypothetical protein
MAVIDNQRSRLVFRYWNASLAWHRPDEFAGKMTNQQFARQVRPLADDPLRVGYLARQLLDDYIRDVRYQPLDIPGEVISLPSFTVQTRKEANA